MQADARAVRARGDLLRAFAGARGLDAGLERAAAELARARAHRRVRPRRRARRHAGRRRRRLGANATLTPQRWYSTQWIVVNFHNCC